VHRKFGFLILIIAIAVAVFAAAKVFRINYWLLTPNEKFQQSWTEDVKLLEKTGQLPKEWQQISEINVRTDTSPVQDWIDKNRMPIQRTASGSYRLDIFLTHWIDHNRYGVVVQYDLIEKKSKNLVWHLGRTFKLGIVY
jgi:hypothetical protein